MTTEKLRQDEVFREFSISNFLKRQNFQRQALKQLNMISETGFLPAA